jgi:TRAP-type C4-dicarboxylate transport system substrate-binding protein
MKSKRTMIALGIAIAVVAVSLGGGCASKEAKTFEWRTQATLAPQVSSQVLERAWAAQISDASGGRLKVTHYSAATLGFGNADMLKAVREGLLEGGEVWDWATTSEIPILDCLAVPSVSFNPAMREALCEALLPYWKKAFDDKNVVLFGVLQANPRCLVTRTEVKTLSDLKGLKIRAAGPMEQQITAAMGATPVTVDWPEVYTAMERKTIDGYWCPLGSTVDAKLYEVAKYIFDCRWGGLAMFWVVNKDAYNELPKDVQKIVDDATNVLFEGLWGEQEASEEQAVQDCLSHGMTMTKAGPEVFKLMQDVEVQQRQAWIDKAKKAGYPGDEIIKTIIDVEAKYQ